MSSNNHELSPTNDELLARVNWRHFPIPPEIHSSFGTHSVCASEADFDLFLQGMTGIRLGTRGYNGDPKTLRLAPGYPYHQGFFSPFAEYAQVAPYPITYLSGTINNNWRDSYVLALEQYGFLSAWGNKVEYQEFIKNEIDFITAMVIMVWGSDVLIFNPQHAGRYSYFERALAEYYRIPIIEAKNNPRDVAKEVLTNHFPISHFPIGDRRLFDLCQDFIKPDELIKSCFKVMSMASIVNRWLMISRPIFDRRAGLNPWGNSLSKFLIY
jgi:hypothetical protein